MLRPAPLQTLSERSQRGLQSSKWAPHHQYLPMIAEIISAHFWELVLLLWAYLSALLMSHIVLRPLWAPLLVLVHAELPTMPSRSLRRSIPVFSFSCSKGADIGLRHETGASVVQTSLLLMNYSRAHFGSNEILNGVLRKSSPLCITELHKVIDLNGNSLLDLMKHEKHSQFIQGEVEWETRVKWSQRNWCLLSYVC